MWQVEEGADLSVLAKDGGAPVRTAPFPRWPCFGAEEIQAAARVLASGKVNYWTGQEGRLFESEFAAFTQCRHAVALANGTVALELAFRALGLGPGDDVVVPSRTFIASASSAVLCGARPVFADVDPVSQNLTAQTIEEAMTPNTRAVVAVHLAGWPCDMDSILELAHQKNLLVIEDCAQALGATYRGRRVGSMGDVGAFSFCQDKIFTTGGEGGMLTTNNPEVWKRVWSLKDHGKSFDAVQNLGHPPSWAYLWLHESFGTNARLTEMQSGIGRVALRKVEDWIRIRHRNASILTEEFRGTRGLRITEPPAYVGHSYYKYYVFVDPGSLRAGWGRDQILQALIAEGIPCFSGSCSELYLEQTFEPGLRPDHRLPFARQLGETSIMLLVHPTLTDDEMNDTARALEKVMAAAVR